MEKSKKENISIGKISELFMDVYMIYMFWLELSKEFLILIMEMELH